MRILPQKLKRYQFFCLVSSFFLAAIATAPVRLAIADYQAPSPQAILTLGGSSDREEFTALFAQNNPALEIWVSSGFLAPNRARQLFQAAGIPDRRVHIDYRAVDTVTNFTSLIAEFKKRNIRHLYVITSDYHMPRAKSIATFVLGSQGIAFTPVSVPSNKPAESWWHVLRDIGRAILWLFTGRTGASLNPEI